MTLGNALNIIPGNKEKIKPIKYINQDSVFKIVSVQAH